MPNKIENVSVFRYGTFHHARSNAEPWYALQVEALLTLHQPDSRYLTGTQPVCYKELLRLLFHFPSSGKPDLTVVWTRKAMTTRKQGREFEIHIDPIDAILVAAIIGLAISLLYQLTPSLSVWLWQVWKLCRIVLTFWKWPLYAWTCVGVAALVGLLLLKARQDS